MKIRTLAKLRGVRGHITMHGLRHSLLTPLANEGLELAALKGVARRAQMETTTDVYGHGTTRHHEPVRRIVGGLLEAGIRAGEEQRAADAGRFAEYHGRVHRATRQMRPVAARP
ncbi:hypothetical protein [Micromonospora sp. NPDC048898]|uniref:hypothetical protein n=1 Tax=Micromonospora sp. NPDC048898 TaxID=3364260 RepID=UPI00371C1F26